VTRQPKLLYLVSEDWYFVSHRLPLAIAAKAAGFDVSVATLVTGRGEMIRDAGLRLIPINFARSGLHPLRERRSISELAALYIHEAPDLVHNVAVKPVIYGTRAARRAGVKGVVNALMGLGWAFSSDSPKARALRPFIKRALRRALSAPNTRTIVQNADDAALLIDQRLTPPASIRLIRGSGVDPDKYATGAPPSDTPPLIVFPARLLVDKGVEEFLRAAAILRKDGVVARFALVGEPDPANPASLSTERIEALACAADAELWGWREDMPSVLAEAAIVCLPSYREGLPKALLEAAASARAIVATDVPGCREIVRPGVNGWLVPPRDASALAAALREAIARPALCARYGAAGRRLVERELSLDVVIRDTLAVYGELVALPTPAVGTSAACAANAEPGRRTA
jgi:glycosyltransferase involved in cell wall biosynthesis